MAGTFSDKVLNFLKEDRAALKKVATAVGQAIRQEIAENKKAGKQSFHVMEGTVYKHKNGRYEFIPNKTLQAILDGDSLVAPILQVEESRFLELLKLSMYELAEPEIKQAAEEKEKADIAKSRKQAEEAEEARILAEQERKKKEGW